MSDTTTIEEPERGLLRNYIHLVDLARELRVTPHCVIRYTKEPNGLPVLTVGGRKYFSKSDVKAWLERRTRRPNPTRLGRARQRMGLE